MLCCAIAVFILSQAYVALSAVREALFGRADSRVEAGAAAAWRLGAPAAPRRRLGLLRMSGPRLAAAFGVGFACIATAAVAARHGEAGAFLWQGQQICGRLLHLGSG
jgi:hypothetical protein